MPTQEVQVTMIANQMMKGPRGGRYALGSTETERTLFRQIHEPMIRELVPILPRGSGAMGAAIMKCALRYGKKKAFAFTKRVSSGMFEGKNDPAYLLWSYLQTGKKPKTRLEKTIDAYRKAATCCRAACENRTLKELRARNQNKASDIFEWDENWQVPENKRFKGERNEQAKI